MAIVPKLADRPDSPSPLGSPGNPFIGRALRPGERVMFEETGFLCRSVHTWPQRVRELYPEMASSLLQAERESSLGKKDI